MADDPLIAQAEGAEVDAKTARRAASLFDLRRIIAALFGIYGVILVILGLGASDAEIDKAAGWNLNLWVGVAMLVIAAIFVLWAFGRPLSEDLDDADAPEGDRTVPGAHAPTGPDAAALGGSQTTRRTPRKDLGRPGE